MRHTYCTPLPKDKGVGGTTRTVELMPSEVTVCQGKAIQKAKEVPISGSTVADVHLLLESGQGDNCVEKLCHLRATLLSSIFGTQHTQRVLVQSYIQLDQEWLQSPVSMASKGD